MASHEEFMQQYHHALINEIKDFSLYNHDQVPLKTIYFGGGTPSTYPGPLLLDTFAILRKSFIFDDNIEITLEVNPGTVTKELLETWKAAGINRLSIGVQSLKDVVLKSLNRHQTRQDVEQVLRDASSYIHNLSVDFIIGLPGVSDDEWRDMIKEAALWPIKHISIYFLTVHEDTPLYFKVASKKISLPPDDALVDLYDWTVEYLSQYGFNRYEVSNFAKQGYESKHNAAYWDRKTYKGFGLGACSFNGSVRFQNTKNLGCYIAKKATDQDFTIAQEVLNASQIRLEKLMLALRQSKGLEMAILMDSLTLEQQQVMQTRIQLLQDIGLILLHNNTMFK